ncbi:MULTISPECIES: hypothetical protein [unclassified Rhizobacter]|uniref:hypothetical protein n=1 Tax=unclassified Rhizobacter TaxID=2640088 RepID=UPI000B07D7DA|nr:MULTISPECIES: hypothetical protein [unclassified Rhizobacter]
MAKRTIGEEISELSQQFEKLARDLFSITRPLQLFDYENGVYGEIYFRPNKRLSKIFSTDREVLVLITNFPDQQQRTITALKGRIDEASGRVENSLAIIVHADSDGNRKLKMWGREKGIAILPILARESFQDAETFERDLLLDFFSNDPFDVTGPVSDDARFFGRRTEALDIARQLQGGQIRSSLGIRKIGKTSILNRILYEAKVNHGSVCVMIDCSKDDIWAQSASELLCSIGEAVAASAGNTPHYAEVQQSCENDGGLSGARKALLNAVLASDPPVILFFDEVDYITPGSPTARAAWTSNFNPFWRNLRAVTQEAARSEKKFSLFVCGVSSKWFKEESIDGVENAVLSFIPEEYLSPLAPIAITGMIRSISRTAGLSFDDATAEFIGQACGNMPYWTRKACSYIHRNIDVRDRPCIVQRETAERLVGEFVEEEGAAVAEVALNHLFRVHPEVYIPAKSVLDGGRHAKSEQLISTLIRYGILAEVRGEVVLGSGMIREGMRLCIQKRSEIEMVPAPLEESSSLILKFDEWADELALINASRNKLEKRLRALALNFIKFSTLQSRDKGTAASRVIRCVEKVRIEKLQHLPADDLIEKLLWSELVRLVEKEWVLFIPVFADLRLFKEHATILNDRMDAHAKDADGADLAYYRRSLRWLEEAVQKASA